MKDFAAFFPQVFDPPHSLGSAKKKKLFEVCSAYVKCR